MLVPAALQRWAAEHQEQLSPETQQEVRVIGSALERSALAERDIASLTQTDLDVLRGQLGADRSERASLLLNVTRNWFDTIPTPSTHTPPPPTPPTATAPTATAPPVDPPTATSPVGFAISTQQANPPDRQAASLAHAAPAAQVNEIATPTFLGSDKVDEEDTLRLHGPERSPMLWVGVVAGLLVLGALAAGAWFLFARSNDADTSLETDVVAVPTSEDAVAAPATSTPENETAATDTAASGAGTDTQAVAVDPTVAAEIVATPVPTPADGYWADTDTVLNAGTTAITASTYNVSPANRAVLNGHTAGLTGVVVALDGRVLTSGEDQRLVNWGREVTLAQPDVLNVASPLTALTRTDGDIMVMGDQSGGIAIIDLSDESSTPQTLRIHPVAISALTALDANTVAVASVNGEVRIFETDSPQQFVAIEVGTEVTAMAAIDPATLITATASGAIELWDLTVTPPVSSLVTERPLPVTAMTSLADGRIASADVAGAIHIGSAVPGATPDLVLVGHIGAVRALHEFEPGRLASGGDDGTLRVWDLVTGSAVLLLEGHGDRITGIANTLDGRLVSAGADGTGRVWDLERPPGALVFAPHERNVSAVASLGGTGFVSGGLDGQVVLGTATAGTQPITLHRHLSPVVGAAPTTSGEIVSLDATGNLRLTSPLPGTPLLFDGSVGSDATALAVRGADGVATGHNDGTVRLHDFVDQTATLERHNGAVTALAAMSDGRIVSGGVDKIVQITDPADPAERLTFELHVAAIDAVAALDDGRIASAGTDGIYVWSPDNPGESIRLTGHRSPVLSLVPMPNDQLLSSAADGRVRLWDLSRPDLDAAILIDVPGANNPYLTVLDDGTAVAGAARGHLFFPVR